MECGKEPRPPLPFRPLVNPKQTTTREMHVQTSETSMWAAVAAIQAIDKTVDTHSARLLRLEGRVGLAEKTLAGCQKTTMEVENQLESKWTMLGTLIKEYGQLQRRLENVENLLKNRNFWILRLPPGAKGETPKVPVTFDDVSVHFNEQEWGDLDELQKELYKTVMKSNYEALVSLDYAIAKPEILTRIEQGEELWKRRSPEGLEGGSIAVDRGTDSPAAPVDVSLWLKQEAEERQCGDLRPPEEMREVSSSSHGGSAAEATEASLWIKEEVEEVCFDPGDCHEEGVCHSASLEYRTVTVDEGSLAAPQEDPCVQEALLLGEGSSTGPATFPPGDMEHAVREQHRGRFYKMMEEILSTKREDNNSYINRDRYRTLIEEVKEAKRLRSKKGKHYRRLRRFNVLNIGTEEKLVVPVSPGHTEVVYFVQYEDLFDILHAAHIAIGHGGRTRMLKELSPEHEITVQLEEDGSEDAKTPLLRSSSRRTASRSPGTDPSRKPPQPGTGAQPIKLEGLLKRPHSPSDCWKSCPQKQAVLSREKTRSATRFYRCIECNRSFGSEDPPSPEGLGSATCPDCKQRQQLSFSVHSDMQPFACVTCGATFSQWTTQLAHQKTHQRAWKHRCADCGAGAETSQEFARHQRAHTIVGRAYRCASCPQNFLSFSELADHQRTHTLGWPFTCSLCKSSFASQDAFATHQTLHATAVERLFPDAKAESASNWPELLSEQMNLYLQTNSRSPWQVVTDLVRKNPELWPFPCTQCGAKFLSQRALSSHRCGQAPSAKPPAQLVSGQTGTSRQGVPSKPQQALDQPFQCPYCSHSYVYKEALTSHLLSHFTQKPFRCYICSREFPEPLELAGHISAHFTHRPFKCSQCSKSFSRPGLLTEHQREHVTEKPSYCCKQCTRSFAHPGLLKEHLLCHTMERPFHCDRCSRSYSYQGLLEEHKRKHAEEALRPAQPPKDADRTSLASDGHGSLD